MEESVELKPVVSSNVDAVGYDPGKKELHVKFKGSKGEVYVYADVPQDKADAMNAEGVSVGRYLNTEIKGVHIFDKREPKKDTLKACDSCKSACDSDTEGVLCLSCSAYLCMNCQGTMCPVCGNPQEGQAG